MAVGAGVFVRGTTVVGVGVAVSGSGVGVEVFSGCVLVAVGVGVSFALMITGVVVGQKSPGSRVPVGNDTGVSTSFWIS